MKPLLATLALALLPLAAQAAPVVELTTNKGAIELTLDAARAPKTVANFMAYVKSGHYNGTVFHRVIDGFMVQGGGFDTRLNQKPTRPPVPNEANNGLKNTVGTVAMARTMDPNSATAQFFINVADNDFLDYKAPTPQGWGYAVFGRVTRGMDVVNRIAKIRTGRMNGMDDVPFEPIVIQKAVVKSEQ
ncbi:MULTISPECIES: peptidylprolyl isomerase [Gulbenkiania]|uniref:Peptidyl-prolyl cis-trans isomerase n=2 Tax=Gulbenkiania TaxID=397456 RepID=A0A0K6GUV5_9NEIS|nr:MULTISPECIES: peptidylprolyl isomerase [Gulbenkiania]TCW33928.1 peptidylprolyl isomerase/peptidyl-prolyl cis-trans isomerase A (cyclophilin A)/peptidyl-prolyl cis-trans isomerase B (cyclophilin B) [Gulbenkiania mobilis]CUA82297.1 Peptidyl-prolyl cis-trans isomerase (rotamase)-cyclophilin family [Gulbenkiania indica]